MFVEQTRYFPLYDLFICLWVVSSRTQIKPHAGFGSCNGNIDWSLGVEI